MEFLSFTVKPDHVNFSSLCSTRKTRQRDLPSLAQSLWNMFSVMADTFYATFELKNSGMEGLFFIFWGNIDTMRYSATEFGRN